VERSARWLPAHPDLEEQQEALARLPGLAWERCGLRLLRPPQAFQLGRAVQDSLTLERHIYERRREGR